MKVWVVDCQSEFDGGFTLDVFSSDKKARSFIESQKNFKGWFTERSTNEDKNGFFYEYDLFEVN